MAVVYIHFDLDGNLQKGSPPIIMDFLVSQTNRQGPAEDIHVDIPIGIMDWQGLILVENHMHVMKVLIHDDGFDGFLVRLGQLV